VTSATLGKGPPYSARFRAVRSDRTAIGSVFGPAPDHPPLIAAVEPSRSRKIHVKTWGLSGPVQVGIAGASLVTRPAALQAEHRPGRHLTRAQ